jgi:DNA replication protein DnaC
MSTDLDPLLKRLSLANARRAWRDMVARAEREDWTYEALLQTLFAEEVAHRRGTRLARAVRDASFPFLRTVEEFDFTYQSTLRLTTIGSLLSADFVTGGHSVILEGKPGRGKTHLAIAIAYRAMQNGFDALFVTAAALIDELSAAGRDGQLREAVARYVRPHVLVVDEVGYLTYGDDAANVLFHVVNERHIKHRAMVFTTNKSPKSWGTVLHDDDLAEAIVDRILERGRHLRLDGPSVRTRHLAPDTTLEDTDSGRDGVRISGTDPPEFPERTRMMGQSESAKLSHGSRPSSRSRDANGCVGQCVCMNLSQMRLPRAFANGAERRAISSVVRTPTTGQFTAASRRDPRGRFFSRHVSASFALRCGRTAFAQRAPRERAARLPSCGTAFALSPRSRGEREAETRLTAAPFSPGQ